MNNNPVFDLNDVFLQLGMDGWDDSPMDDVLEALTFDGDMPHVMSRHLDQATEEEYELIRELVLEQGNLAVLSEYVLGDKPFPHHKSMIAWQDYNRQGLLLAWRGAGKSVYVTKARAILEILRNPDIRILICSDALEQAKGLLRGIKSHFEKNERFRAIFGDWVTGAPTWTDTLITVNRRKAHYSEPTITCAGVKTSLPSRHFDLILADDLVTMDNSRTEGERKRIHDYYYQTLYPTLDPHGRLYVIGTRWHRDDLYGWLQKNDHKASHLVLGVMDESGDEPVSRWPQQFPMTMLENFQRASVEAFELQMMCRESVGVGEIFSDFMFIIDDGPWPNDTNRWQGVDLAIGQKDHHDKFAHVTIDMQVQTMNTYLQHYFLDRKTFPQQVAFLKTMYERFPTTRGIVVETNAYQQALPQQVLKEFPGLPIIGRNTKYDKITRAQQLAMFLAQRPCYVRSENREFVKLLLGFPSLKGSKDAFDAFFIAHSKARVGKKKRRHRPVGLI